MPIPSRLSLSIAVVFFLISSRSPSASADELSVVSHPSKLQLPPGQPVDSSPGARPGSISNRVHIRGLSRLRRPSKFAHALKVSISVSEGDAIFRIQTIELCFHWNTPLGAAMCPVGKWQKLSKGFWVQSMSPYGNRILDVRTLPDPSRSVELSTEYEFMFHRLVILVLGMVMMAAAPVARDKVMVLFQGMRLLPTGRRSSLAIFMYSSVVGVATFLLQYLSGLLHSIFVELGISEDMHNPLGIFLLVCLVLAGAWFGYWGVHKLVLSEDGLVDSSVAYFVEWAILIFAAVMILQSSVDTLLAAEALSFSIVISVIARTHGKSFLCRLFKPLVKLMTRSPVQSSLSDSHDEHSCLSSNSFVQALTKTRPPTEFEQEKFYSTFHKFPERKRFSKAEWKSFTSEKTGEGLTELFSSPEFSKWALNNAGRISVTRGCGTCF